MTLVVCSDHGNFEDLSIKMHTLNPSLCITVGENAGQLSERIKNLSDIKPAIMEMYVWKTFRWHDSLFCLSAE